MFNLMNLTSRKPLHITSLFALSTLAALLLSLPARAQHMAGGRSKTDTIPLFRNSRPTSSLNPDSLIQERLVQLALNGPVYSVSGHQILFAEYNLMKAKRSWL